MGDMFFLSNCSESQLEKLITELKKKFSKKNLTFLDIKIYQDESGKLHGN